jgi:uncharacterized membrane protein YjjP (DUF1212 family)
VKPWVLYSVLRVAIFAGLFLVLWAAGIEGWLAAVLAAVIGLCISYIFLRGQREKVATEFAARRRPSDDARVGAAAGDDENAEDSL